MCLICISLPFLVCSLAISPVFRKIFKIVIVIFFCTFVIENNRLIYGCMNCFYAACPITYILKITFYWHFSVKSFYNFQMTCLIQFCYISRLIIFNDSRFTINRICTNIIFFTKLLCYSFTSL